MNSTTALEPPDRPQYDRRATLKGAVALLFTTFDSDVLLDGPAGTGKTFGLIRYCDWLARQFPGVRFLWIRETLHCLRESVQQLYEDFVLWPGHPCIMHGGSRGQRTHYEYPNGSRIVLAGLDTPERIMSTEYDVICLFEATNPHVTERAWNLLSTRCRAMNIPHPLCRYPTGVLPDGMPTRQAVVEGVFPGAVDEDGKPLFLNRMIADCNPDAKSHWLWRLYESGKLVRLRSRHADNPTTPKRYLDRLAALPGVYRERLYLGEWVAAEGVVWPTYSAKRHNVRMNFQREALTGRRIVEVPDWLDDQGHVAQFTVSGVIGGMDFGWTNPGCLLIAAVTSDRRAFVLREVYAAERPIEDWAKDVVDAVDEYKIECIRADPSRPDMIDLLNQRLGGRAGREVGGIVQPANNRKRTTTQGDLGGLDIVREAFRQDRLFFNTQMLVRRDPKLDAEHMPCSVVDEVPNYVFDTDPKTSERLDTTPKDAIDHGCDALRYLGCDVWERTWSIPKEPMFTPAEGTVEYRVGTLAERQRLMRIDARSRERRRLTWS